jgi:ABC-type sugar transport system ATPase subunit
LLGIRPEDLLPRPVASSDGAISAVVDIVEPIGGRCLVYSIVGDSTIVAEVSTGEEPEIGGSVTFSFDTRRLHAFDSEVEQALW